MKFRHPNLNEPNVIDVDESDADAYTAAGWVPVDKKPARTPAPANKPASGAKESN